MTSEELKRLDDAGLEAAVRECARITAPEISDEELAQIKADNSPRYQNTRTEMARAITAYLSAASVKAGEAVAVKSEPVAWLRCAVAGDAPKPCNEDEDGAFPVYRATTPAPTASVGAMREALVRTLASLAAAISLLERTPKAKKAAPSDKMFDQMIVDYKNALEAGRKAALAAANQSDVEALAATTAERPGTVTSEPEPSTSDPDWKQDQAETTRIKPGPSDTQDEYLAGIMKHAYLHDGDTPPATQAVEAVSVEPGPSEVNVETIAALLYEAANPTMKWSYLWPSRNHLHAAVKQRYIEAAARFEDAYLDCKVTKAPHSAPEAVVVGELAKVIREHIRTAPRNPDHERYGCIDENEIARALLAKFKMEGR